MRKLALLLVFILMMTGCAQNADVYDNPEDDIPSPDNSEAVIPEDDDDNSPTPIYDTSAILEAYRSGDRSNLSEKDLTILEEAEKVIPEFYEEGMSEPDIVAAAHDWIVTHLTYDENELLAIPHQTPDTENPYGALTLRQGICMGYTTLFQLFMDMLGVESQIIRGEGDGINSWEEHAWNLVHIDGNYYHVDATWDDFAPDEEGRIPFHFYVMVPDSVMKILHRWNEEDYPKADSYDLLYYKSHGLYVTEPEEIDRIQSEAIARGDRYCEVMTDGGLYSFGGGATAYWDPYSDKYTVTVYWLYPYEEYDPGNFAR